MIKQHMYMIAAGNQQTAADYYLDVPVFSISKIGDDGRRMQRATVRRQH